jgi:omega-6 fatty acid desaturase (delta-12 desaturase)
MGKGGSAAVKERFQLANTIPQPSEQITKRSIREAIPAHCFKRSYTHSFAALAWDVVMVFASYGVVAWASRVLPAYAMPPVWLFYWWYQSLTFTGLWVLAHECGHGGFTDSRVVNDAVGFVVHSALLAPYFSWAITHAKHHHYTNHMTMGETWVPATVDPNRSSVKKAKTTRGTLLRIAIVATIGWWAYLINNDTGARQNKGQSHFNPHAKALFKPKDRNYVRASNVGMFLTFAALALAVKNCGFFAVAMAYWVPQIGANFYLAAITFMQHTHPDVPHFEDEDWTWLRGAISTIDRSMGPFADYKTHYIVSSHVAHHIFSEMPYYGALEATPYIKKHLGQYYKSALPKPMLGSEFLGYWRDFYLMMQASVTVGKEPEEDGFLWFK